jgi:hypothetical protein
MGKALGLDFNLICHFVIMYKSQKIRHPGMDCRDQDYRDVCVDRIQCGECVLPSMATGFRQSLPE